MHRRHVVFERPEAGVYVTRESADLLCVQLRGSLPAAAGLPLEAVLRAEFDKSQGLHAFWDLGKLSKYHSEVRICATRLLLAQRHKVLSLHTFTRSKLVSMGVAVANLALGGIVQIHPDKESYEAALRERLG